MRLACESCGALSVAGETCRDCFDALLAFENERPPAFGAVHHLTVPCYFLQHPAGYSMEILGEWRSALADILDRGTPASELQARVAKRFAGAKRVREVGARPPAWWPAVWPMSVHNVLRPDQRPSVPEYVARARNWASATRAALDAAAAQLGAD